MSTITNPARRLLPGMLIEGDAVDGRVRVEAVYDDGTVKLSDGFVGIINLDFVTVVAEDPAQAIADGLREADILPRRWGIYKVEIIQQAGGSGPKCTVRAQVGRTPHDMIEIAGFGFDVAEATVKLHNRARRVA